MRSIPDDTGNSSVVARLPVSARAGRRVSRLRDRRPGAARYARVATRELKADLDRRVARMEAAAAAHGIRVVGIAREISSGVDLSRSRLRSLLDHRYVDVIVVEIADRIATVTAELIEACLKSVGRRLLLVDPALGPRSDEIEEAVRRFLLHRAIPQAAWASARRPSKAAFEEGWKSR
ncbi:MAG: recombinase family protein [Candidatus Dormiibacterota bacterium]